MPRKQYPYTHKNPLNWKVIKAIVRMMTRKRLTTISQHQNRQDNLSVKTGVI